MADRPRRTRRTDVSVVRVRAGGVYVRVSTVGTEGERPFVLVPGIGVSSNYFERLAPSLNEYGPVHALDLPGFGGVPHPASKLSIAEYADLVGTVIDELGLKDPILVGHSMGTQVVTDLAARRPELSTVVLIGPVVNAAERRVRLQARRFLQCALREPGRVKTLALSAYLLCGFKWFYRVLPEMMEYRIEDQLPRVQASTLVIRGQYDFSSPADWVERVAGLLPRARAYEIPDAAHSVMHAHAEEVARLCVEHARDPAIGPTSERLQRIPADALDESSTDITARVLLQSVQGRVVELRGILGDEDRLIAEGKTIQAEALDRATRPDGSGVVKSADDRG
jgi:pimeloyl-ACP methyl ester carboxylesterase